MMVMGKFSDDFKRDAVAQITERGYPVAEVSKRLGVTEHPIYALEEEVLKAHRAELDRSSCNATDCTGLGHVRPNWIW